MEEIVGKWWHQAVTRFACLEHPHAVVHLDEVKKSIGVLFRAAGGPPALRLAPASEQLVGAQRNWLQRMAGSGRRADTAQLEPDVLALPGSLAVFADHDLNRDLYLWLAIQSACFDNTTDWIADNCRATQLALGQFPGFGARYQKLLNAHLALRPSANALKGLAAQSEAIIQSALRGSCPMHSHLGQHDVAAVWLWLKADNIAPTVTSRSNSVQTHNDPDRKAATQDKQRRRTQQTNDSDGRNAMVLPFRGEALMSWSEMVQVNRSTDDEDDGNAINAANDMDKLSVAPDGQTLASRVKFDLDLPSASADDVPVGPGVRLPEWDYRRATLQPEHCLIQVMESRSTTPFVPSPSLKLSARRIRRRLETLRDAPRPQRGQDSGDDIDLDAWVRFSADQTGHAGLHSDTPAIYTRRVRSERSLATLLLADLSMSTDAYATPQAKVIDVIRDALFVFGEALHAVGDPFAGWGFSSVRRHSSAAQQ